MKITWGGLHDVGTSKVVNTSYIWLALIPFLTRALEALHAAGTHVPTLPFNFIAFYYAAFCFTAGAAVFNLFCPKVIKLTPTFGTFASEQYSLIELKNWWHDMVMDEPRPEERARLLEQFLLLEKPNQGISYPVLDKSEVDAKILNNFWEENAWTKRDALPLLHDLAVKYAEKLNPNWRRFATAMYGIGFILFGVVVVLNLFVVAKETGRIIAPMFLHAG